MLDQHQPSAAGTKGLDTNELALLFTVSVQYDMDRITGDVLYLLYEIRIPILFRFPMQRFQLPDTPNEIGRREKERENSAYIEHGLRPQPSHQPVITWRRGSDHPEAR